LSGYAIVANTDTVFTVFNIDGVVKLADLGLSGITVKAGAYLPVPEGSSITDITMASGDCLIYNQ
jgi:D-ribose pyranose/furanose isomerase RbsD